MTLNWASGTAIDQDQAGDDPGRMAEWIYLTSQHPVHALWSGGDGGPTSWRWLTSEQTTLLGAGVP